MSTKRIVAGAISLFGLLAVASGANAASTLATAVRPNGAVIAQDSWNVFVQSFGSGLYGVKVIANTGPDSNPPQPSSMDTLVHSLSLQFYSSVIPTTASIINPVSPIIGGSFKTADDSLLELWDQGLSSDSKSTVFEEKPGGTDYGLNFDKSNYFLGYLQLGSEAVSFNATVRNGSISWNAYGDLRNPDQPGIPELTPEGSGAAALLPALLPIGLVALKRRKANKKEAAAA